MFINWWLWCSSLTIVVLIRTIKQNYVYILLEISWRKPLISVIARRQIQSMLWCKIGTIVFRLYKWWARRQEIALGRKFSVWLDCQCRYCRKRWCSSRHSIRPTMGTFYKLTYSILKWKNDIYIVFTTHTPLSIQSVLT